MTTELTAVLETMDPELILNALTGLGVVFIVAMVFAIARYLMHAIGYGAMYRKAGVASWKAFIPVYNTYNNYKISWNGKLFFLYAALMVASTVLGSAEGAMALVGTAVSLGLIYMAVKQHLNMAKLFGKGFGTAIALILFPGITSLILGLGKAEYNAIAE